MLVSPCCLNKCFMEFLNLLLCALLMLVIANLGGFKTGLTVYFNNKNVIC